MSVPARFASNERFEEAVTDLPLAAGEVALTECDREPIHVPGAIQPHGALIVFTDDLRIVAASDNLQQFAGVPPSEIIERPISELLDADTDLNLRRSIFDPDCVAGSPVPIRFLQRGTAELTGLWHRHDGLSLLEVEALRHEITESHAFFSRTSGAIRRLQTAATLEAACAAAAREVREIIGFDRVKVYRFAPDFSGQVIAEDRCNDVESYLGLHFPPSDIPAQARRLYSINPVRIIPNIDYRPVPIAPDLNPITGRPIDLSFAVLRSVSPIHLEYMRNIGMRGTMSVSILRGDRLWGLVACHNREPKFVGHDSRQACEMVARVLAWQIGVMEEQAITRQTLKGKAIQRSLINDIEQLHDHRAGLARNSEALLELMGASGLCLYGREGATSIGRTPPIATIEKLAKLVGQSSDAELFQTDRLATVLPEAEAFTDIASGVLAVPLSRTPPRRVMLWFRPEISQTVYWAGNPDKSMTIDSGRLRPRRSFSAWTEEVRGRALPWETHEIAAAVEIRDLVIDVILRNTEKLERVNSRLARSNEELEAFAHVASHDIKEPLRHIEAFAGLLGESIREIGDERLGLMVSGIEKSSRRLRNLINDLAEFSQLGRRSKPLAWISLGEVAREARSDLHQQVEEAAADVTIEDLPRARCDGSQIRQVLQNLLSNALKYRDPRRRCQIRVYAEHDPDAQRRADDTYTARICVSDNGIGFDPKYTDQIFEPFQRLHGPDDYEGSGIGLAICRNIVQRHGGHVGVETQPDSGSVFWFTLPVAANDAVLNGDRP
ncbi:ATP-binding protein [Rhodopseudomonas pseudopalustris]|uniref:ATP-binding protein n=1 Tax=Rhodopseudomonas pseudopalustris TaxID=1513892 RepID=UPI003F94876F